MREVHCTAAKCVVDVHGHLYYMHAEQDVTLSQLRRQQEAKIGVGVSPEAQAIFLALAKTMTCHWDGPVINVLEEVLLLTKFLPQLLTLWLNLVCWRS